jgi:hypothetical protein
VKNARGGGWHTSVELPKVARERWRKHLRGAGKCGISAPLPPVAFTPPEPLAPRLRQHDVTIKKVAELLANAAPKDGFADRPGRAGRPNRRHERVQCRGPRLRDWLTKSCLASSPWLAAVTPGPAILSTSRALRALPTEAYEPLNLTLDLEYAHVNGHSREANAIKRSGSIPRRHSGFKGAARRHSPASSNRAGPRSRAAQKIISCWPTRPGSLGEDQ